MVTIRTPTPGCSRLMWRVAVVPSIPGIRTSISTRSGSRRRQISMASTPFDASPTTSSPGSLLSRLRNPRRRRWWSSTRMSRFVAFIGDLSSCMIGVLPCRWQFNLRLYRRTGPRLAMEFEPPAEQGYPLAHAGKADPLTGTVTPRRLIRLEAASFVPDQQANRVSRAVERHAYPGSPRVLAYVRQCLLRDPEERRLYLGWQTVIAQRLFEADLPALRLERLDLQTDCGGQAEVVEHRGA